MQLIERKEIIRQDQYAVKIKGKAIPVTGREAP
jgi:hypothetical protein